jgi:fatty acid synthase subunit alpha
VYERHGSAPSQLIVLPCNGASVGDLEAMVEFIYESERADIDIVVPFAAISEQSTEISDIGGRSELAHRLMMTNVVRLLGLIKSKKAQKAIVTRPAHVLLPLSPNHGTFGGDGLYAESKLGLEALMNKWHAEGWRQYLTLAGARIGWTRGTGLMRVNDRVAPALEQLGARTFDVQEQCFNLCALAHPLMIEQAQRAPVFADLNGALHMVDDMRVIVRDVREQINETARVRRAVTADAARDAEADGVSAAGDKAAATAAAAASECLPRANVRVEMPPLPDAKRRAALGAAKGLVDLDKVVVVFGFGEVGPYGNARTRWEMESYGEFSLEGCVELAWMCGLIRADGSGWVDAASGEPVPDHQIKARYEETLLKHSGIRIIEPELFGGYDPEKKMFLRAVALQHDVGPIEVSEAEASQFLRQHGPAHCAAWCDSDGIWRVTLRRGAVLYVPKALRFDRFVAGQIPTHWSPERLGIPADIVRQVDRVTLFTLVSTAEALISAGVTDPYEFYRYVHLRDVGNAIGGGFGGMQSMRGVYRDRLMEEPVQGDALQETFINTVAAWVNMLLLSSAGPIKTPVGACATAVESIELGMDTIELGKAAIVVVSAATTTLARRARTSLRRCAPRRRRPPRRRRAASRAKCRARRRRRAAASWSRRAPACSSSPAPRSRSRWACRSMACSRRCAPPPTRRAARCRRRARAFWSVPASGTTPTRRCSRSTIAASSSRSSWRRSRRGASAATAEATAHGSSGDTRPMPRRAPRTAQQQLAFVDAQARRKRAAAFEVWGQSFYRGDASIAPLRGALAAWGLTIDDIEVASFHGTGTTANDFNESDVLQRQLEHLGRTRGNSLMAVFQKHFTGHPKGAAAAWMLNGLLQSIQSGIIPGNRNADNIDQSLRQFDHIVYMNRPLQTYGYRAALLKSFGFGQVGGEVLVIHPDYVFAQLDDAEFDGYAVRRHEREQAAYRHIQDSLAGRRPYLAVKTHPPFAPEHEQRVYLDPSCRAVWSDEKQTWMFDVARSDSPRDRRTPTDDDGGMSNLAEVALRAAQSRRSRAASASIARVASDGASELVGAVGDDGDDNDDGERDGDDDDDDDDLSSSPTSPLSPALRRRLPISAQTALEVTLREMSIGMRAPADRGIGVDLQVISEIDAALSSAGERFVARNFTPAEIAYCRQQPNPGASFAGRWAAKESVVKALTNCDNEGGRRLWEGAGAPLVDIEIVATAAGAPRVQLHGHAERVAQALGVSDIRVSISHSGDHAIAHAVAR